ncbi:polysaccharide deacetylase family protein [Priestia megaterium]|nr:polysaccharide deacetylase family protein [Priestia megaterium]
MSLEMAIEGAKLSSAPGWPVALYFHHVHPTLNHYTSLTPSDFEKAIYTALEVIGPSLDPNILKRDSQLDLPNEPTVLFTFDDGYKDNIDYALPILDKYDVKALFFITNNFIAKDIDINSNPRMNFMNYSDIKQLMNKNHVIGAHTLTHPNLSLLSNQEVIIEIENSIENLSELLDCEIMHFAYPYGYLPKNKFNFKHNIMAFGTVKAPPIPWDQDHLNIRRTYFPTGASETWNELAKGWRKQWRSLQ